MSSHTHSRGNAIALAALVILAIGGLAYYKIKDRAGDTPAVKVTQTAEANATMQDTKTADTPEADVEIKPGNPVVATVNGTEIKRLDVLGFIQTLPEQTRQAPISELFPAALNQVVNNTVINLKTNNVNLDRDAEVRKQLEVAKKNIVRNVYVQQQVTKQITDERVAKAYEQYKENFPEIKEVKARHILVKDKKTARDLIKQLNDGGDFETLAKENSTDGTAENGGLVGYFAENEVVEPFAKAAFAMDVNEYTTAPVKSDFGYHVIQVLEKRQRPPAELAQVKPFLEAQLRNVMLTQMVEDWREKADVKTFDINGEEIDAKAAAQTAPEAGAQAPDVAPAAGE